MNGPPSAREELLLDELGSPDTNTRLSAALRLNQSANLQILEALRAALDDASGAVAGAAAQSLALVEDIDSLDLVTAAAERSTEPWPRSSLWAAARLAAASDLDQARARVIVLLDLADQAGPGGREQANLLRPLVSRSNLRDDA